MSKTRHAAPRTARAPATTTPTTNARRPVPARSPASSRTRSARPRSRCCRPVARKATTSAAKFAVTQGPGPRQGQGRPEGRGRRRGGRARQGHRVQGRRRREHGRRASAGGITDKLGGTARARARASRPPAPAAAAACPSQEYVDVARRPRDRIRPVHAVRGLAELHAPRREDRAARRHDAHVAREHLGRPPLVGGRDHRADAVRAHRLAQQDGPQTVGVVDVPPPERQPHAGY